MNFTGIWKFLKVKKSNKYAFDFGITILYNSKNSKLILKSYIINFIIITLKITELNVVLCLVFIDILIDSCCKTQVKHSDEKESVATLWQLLRHINILLTNSGLSMNPYDSFLWTY